MPMPPLRALGEMPGWPPHRSRPEPGPPSLRRGAGRALGIARTSAAAARDAGQGGLRRECKVSAPQAGDERTMAHAMCSRSPDPDRIPAGAMPKLMFHRFFRTAAVRARTSNCSPMGRPGGRNRVANHGRASRSLARDGEARTGQGSLRRLPVYAPSSFPEARSPFGHSRRGDGTPSIP